MAFFNSSLILSFIISIFFVCSCDIPTFETDNPFDPQNPVYVAPSVTINSGPSENDSSPNIDEDKKDEIVKDDNGRE